MSEYEEIRKLGEIVRRAFLEEVNLEDGPDADYILSLLETDNGYTETDSEFTN